MDKLKFALFGAGFWANYQLHGWQATGLAECVAICDPNRAKAEALAQKFGIPAVYTDPETLLSETDIACMDICTPVETHAPLTHLAIQHGLAVICQKPLSTTLADAAHMVAAAEQAGVPLLVNENFRWQTPLRHLKAQLDSGRIGDVFRAKLNFSSSFAVFDNQPFLKDLEQFIMTDVGSHILDMARFLFGEARTVYCRTARIHADIKGEDVATVMLEMASGALVICEMSYATRREYDRFPETYIEIEGTQGFLELAPDYWVRETTQNGTLAQRYAPPRYAWADPAYDLVHSSIVPCQTNLGNALLGRGAAETTGADNLKTLELIFAAYASAASGQVVQLPFTG